MNFTTITFSLLLFLIGSSMNAQVVSTYLPGQCEPQALEIIDSLSFGSPHRGVYLDQGMGPAISDQYLYWKTHRENISEKDLFILKNHPSPIVRYYIYAYIIEKGILASKLEFVLAHLHDTQQLGYRQGCVGSQGPLILYIIRHSEFSGEQKAIIANAILEKGIIDCAPLACSQKMTDFVFDHVRKEDQQYNSTRTLALQKDLGAIYELLQYKAKDDEAFVTETIKEILAKPSFYKKSSKSIEYRILDYATKYNFPNGSIDLLYDFHLSAKQNNGLEKSLDRCEIIYKLIMEHNHPSRASVMTDFLQSNFLEDGQYNRPLSRIKKLLYKEHSEDLVALKMLLWEKYGVIQGGDHIPDLKRVYPEKVLSLAKKELTLLLENNEYKKNSLFSTFIEILEENKVATENYINSALDNKNYHLALIAMEVLNDNPFPSSKARVLKYLLETPITTHSFYPNRALHTLSFYKLDKEERKHIQEWCLLAKDEIDFSKRVNPASIQELLDKMGIYTNE